jgi:hypothetical protein
MDSKDIKNEKDNEKEYDPRKPVFGDLERILRDLEIKGINIEDLSWEERAKLGLIEDAGEVD